MKFYITAWQVDEKTVIHISYNSFSTEFPLEFQFITFKAFQRMGFPYKRAVLNVISPLLSLCLILYISSSLVWMLIFMKTLFYNQRL